MSSNTSDSFLEMPAAQPWDPDNLYGDSPSEDESQSSLPPVEESSLNLFYESEGDEDTNAQSPQKTESPDDKSEWSGSSWSDLDEADSPWNFISDDVPPKRTTDADALPPIDDSDSPVFSGTLSSPPGTDDLLDDLLDESPMTPTQPLETEVYPNEINRETRDAYKQRILEDWKTRCRRINQERQDGLRVQENELNTKAMKAIDVESYLLLPFLDPRDVENEAHKFQERLDDAAKQLPRWIQDVDRVANESQERPQCKQLHSFIGVLEHCNHARGYNAVKRFKESLYNSSINNKAPNENNDKQPLHRFVIKSRGPNTSARTSVFPRPIVDVEAALFLTVVTTKGDYSKLARRRRKEAVAAFEHLLLHAYLFTSTQARVVYTFPDENAFQAPLFYLRAAVDRLLSADRFSEWVSSTNSGGYSEGRERGSRWREWVYGDVAEDGVLDKRFLEDVPSAKSTQKALSALFQNAQALKWEQERPPRLDKLDDSKSDGNVCLVLEEEAIRAVTAAHYESNGEEEVDHEWPVFGAYANKQMSCDALRPEEIYDIRYQMANTFGFVAAKIEDDYLSPGGAADSGDLLKIVESESETATATLLRELIFKSSEYAHRVNKFKTQFSPLAEEATTKAVRAYSEKYSKWVSSVKNFLKQNEATITLTENFNAEQFFADNHSNWMRLFKEAFEEEGVPYFDGGLDNAAQFIGHDAYNRNIMSPQDSPQARQSARSSAVIVVPDDEDDDDDDDKINTASPNQYSVEVYERPQTSYDIYDTSSIDSGDLSNLLDATSGDEEENQREATEKQETPERPVFVVVSERGVDSNGDGLITQNEKELSLAVARDLNGDGVIDANAGEVVVTPLRSPAERRFPIDGPDITFDDIESQLLRSVVDNDTVSVSSPPAPSQQQGIPSAIPVGIFQETQGQLSDVDILERALSKPQQQTPTPTMSTDAAVSNNLDSNSLNDVFSFLDNFDIGVPNIDFAEPPTNTGGTTPLATSMAHPASLRTGGQTVSQPNRMTSERIPPPLPRSSAVRLGDSPSGIMEPEAVQGGYTKRVFVQPPKTKIAEQASYKGLRDDDERRKYLLHSIEGSIEKLKNQDAFKKFFKKTYEKKARAQRRSSADQTSRANSTDQVRAASFCEFYDLDASYRPLVYGRSYSRIIRSYIYTKDLVDLNDRFAEILNKATATPPVEEQPQIISSSAYAGGIVWTTDNEPGDGSEDIEFI